jgi:protein-(glutamine-N5) methyltransferase, release factor-specific
MTLGELYRQGRQALVGAGNEAAAFDADCLFQKAFGLDRQARILRSAEPADGRLAEEYLKCIASRAGGRPLQYILGEWPFLDLTLRVGDGVLIPREETELLVHVAADLLRETPAPRMLDLCSGTGAVALGLASLIPGARVAAVEFYAEAYAYLTENIQRTGLQNVEPVRLDVLDAQSAQRFSGLDGIVSNPPYVCAGELPALQREVRREPPTALDGGEDGLLFYRAIAQYWLPRLKPGGFVAVEIGEGQAEEVSSLFRAAGVSKIRVEPDFNGIGRVVSGMR